MSSSVQEVLLSREEFEQRHDRVVREEIEAFRRNAEAFLAGELPEDKWRAFRLKQGIYGQRQQGVQMIRTKVPGGQLTSAQMETMAEVADRHAGGKGHVTTRQNMQFHFVQLREVADLLHLLADAALTNRAACYNAVRNVTASPLAGLHPAELFDVQPYVRRVAYSLLRHELTENLPRKFKIAFDGGTDPKFTLAAINDVGCQAAIRDGKRGFRMVVGGGLGPLPVEAALLDEFVPEEDLLNKIEAVIRVHYKYGNRENRNRARLKFVLRDRGIDWMREHIEQEFQAVKREGGIAYSEMVPEGFGGYQSAPQPLGAGALLPVVGARSNDPLFDEWRATNTFDQKQTGYAGVIVRLDQGNLSSGQMRALAAIARDCGDGTMRITVDQNILLPFIPLARLAGVRALLDREGLAGTRAGEIVDVVSCPGAYSCNLALTKSMNLGAALQNAVRGYDDPEIRKLNIKISGCPNSCGQHWAAEFGFYGNARKIEGKEVPYYLMILGGGYDGEGQLKYGVAVQSLPARLIPEAVRRVIEHYQGNRAGEESFREYVLRHRVEFFKKQLADLVKPENMTPEMFRDWGDDDNFSLQLGRGECAA